MNNGKRPSPRPAVLALSPYVPGKPIEEVEAEYGISGAVKLASNENPLGPSPRALAAAHAALSEVHRYPDGSGTALRRALSKKYGVPEAGIVLGSGGSEILDLAVRTFVDPGEEVLIPDKIFRMVPVAAGRAGASLVTVPLGPGLKPDLAALERRVGPETKILAIANPNNPTGSYLTRDELSGFFARIPTHVLVVLDEAYFEFANGLVPDYPNGLDFLAEGRSVLVVRTLSKSAGLAGLRIGFGFAPVAVADAIHRVREPFNTTSVAQAAALGALEDDEHVRKTRDHVAAEREHLTRELTARGLPPYPSIGNFLLVETPVPFGPIEPEFARRGVILRPMGGWGFPRAFRVSVGTREDSTKFLSVLDEVSAAGFLSAATVATGAAV